MSLEEGKWKKYDEQYPAARECITQSNSMIDSLKCYTYLNDLRDSIPEELYAYYFRKLLNMNTGNVPDDLRLKMFEGVKPENIMYQDEIDAINNMFDEYVTVYRGTSKDESKPGICWTIHKWVAEGTFYRGRLFEAKIPKTSILLYIAHDSDEGEVIAYVKSNYKIIAED